MPRTDVERLRAMVGESIPPNGDASDTLFTDEEIEDILSQSDDVEFAAYEAWREKAAKLSNLVDTTEGNSQKKFSQLLANATDMLKVYSRASGGPTEGRSRVGRLTRPGVEW